jgi:hypothetical protein
MAANSSQLLRTDPFLDLFVDRYYMSWTLMDQKKKIATIGYRATISRGSTRGWGGNVITDTVSRMVSSTQTLAAITNITQMQIERSVPTRRVSTPRSPGGGERLRMTRDTARMGFS